MKKVDPAYPEKLVLTNARDRALFAAGAQAVLVALETTAQALREKSNGAPHRSALRYSLYGAADVLDGAREDAREALRTTFRNALYGPEVK